MSGVDLGQIMSRQLPAGYLPEVVDGATIMVVGTGALGQNTLQNLALAGVGRILVVDRDTFSTHNLTRSPMAWTIDRDPESVIGKSKVEVVARAAATIATNPATRIEWADSWIEDLGFGVFEGVSVIVGAVDSVDARRYLNRASVMLGIPHVPGGFGGPQVNLGVYPRKSVDEACWVCGGVPDIDPFGCGARARIIEKAGMIPSIQPAAAVAGGLQAEATIGVLHGWESGPRRVFMDIRSVNGAYSVKQPPSVYCAKRHQKVAEIELAGTGVEGIPAEILERLGPDDFEVSLNHGYTEISKCPVCSEAIEVNSPTHNWSRNMCCTECEGGIWPIYDGEKVAGPSTVMVHADHPLAGRSFEQLGYSPGDLVEVRGNGSRGYFRLDGDPTGYFTRARRYGETLEHEEGEEK